MTSVLRRACSADLNELYRLEVSCFDDDRFNRRQLTHLVRRAHAVTWLASNEAGHALGYAIVLFRRNSRIARLYSLCVHPAVRGEGIGRRLIESVESEVMRRQRHYLTLEVRADNRIALSLYRRMGYRLCRWLDDYYADGCAAWQMEKRLGQASARDAIESTA
ncbi:GNAT family N-acetyltransferase [Aidingimonas lacisalsi]|uniref:GNAT family N-acetyltransferase n=1 Tax=Aidingimonas lacisalsi TaxID=2604086 RepID=UPI0011D2354E|nr:N-acetyltransferase [Aidingimonas lacisalsi]